MNPSSGVFRKVTPDYTNTEPNISTHFLNLSLNGILSVYHTDTSHQKSMDDNAPLLDENAKKR
jgi:hypothetical protein